MAHLSLRCVCVCRQTQCCLCLPLVACSRCLLSLLLFVPLWLVLRVAGMCICMVCALSLPGELLRRLCGWWCMAASFSLNLSPCFAAVVSLCISFAAPMSLFISGSLLVVALGDGDLVMIFANVLSA